MNRAPVYRRRRRVVFAIIATVMFLAFHFTGGADVDIPEHRSPVTRSEWLGSR